MEKGLKAAFERFVGAHFDGTTKINYSRTSTPEGDTRVTFEGGRDAFHKFGEMKVQLASQGIDEKRISTSDGFFSVTLPNVPASVDQLNAAASDAAQRDVTERTRTFVDQMKERLTAANGGNKVATDQTMQAILEAHTQRGNTLAGGEGFRDRYGAGITGAGVLYR